MISLNLKPSETMKRYLIVIFFACLVGVLAGPAGNVSEDDKNRTVQDKSAAEPMNTNGSPAGTTTFTANSNTLTPAIPPQNMSTDKPTNTSSTTPPPTTTTPPPTTTTTSSTTPPPTTTTTTSPTTPPPTTTTTPTPITTSIPTTNTTTLPTSPVTPVTTTTSAPKPATTTLTPTDEPTKDRRFDGPSFIGGIVLSLGIMAIAFVAWKFYKARTERNYHTL